MKLFDLVTYKCIQENVSLQDLAICWGGLQDREANGYAEAMRNVLTEPAYKQFLWYVGNIKAAREME